MNYVEQKERAISLADGQPFSQWIGECQLNGIDKAVLQDWHKWKSAGQLHAELRKGADGFELLVTKGGE